GTGGRWGHRGGGVGVLVGATHLGDTAEDPQKFFLHFSGRGVENPRGVGGFWVAREARLGDGGLGPAEPLRGAHAGLVLIGIKLGAHARLFVLREMRSPKVASTCSSASRVNGSVRQASRMAAWAPARSPFSRRAGPAATLPSPEIGLSPVKARMVASPACSCHSMASARLRSMIRLGQLGLAAMKLRYREKSALLSSLRRIAHSTSLRARGSAMRC